MYSMGDQGLIPAPHGVYAPLGVIPAYLSVAPNSASTLTQKSITQELRIKPEGVFFLHSQVNWSRWSRSVSLSSKTINHITFANCRHLAWCLFPPELCQLVPSPTTEREGNWGSETLEDVLRYQVLVAAPGSSLVLPCPILA